MAQCEPPRDVWDIASELIEKKASTREMGSAPLPPAIRAFVDTEFAEAREYFQSERTTAERRGKAAAEARFPLRHPPIRR